MYKSLVLETQLTLDKYKDFVVNYLPIRYLSNLKDFIYCLVGSIQHSDNPSYWRYCLLFLSKITPQTLILQEYLYDYFSHSAGLEPGLFEIVNLDETKFQRKFIYNKDELKAKIFYKEAEIGGSIKPYSVSKLSEKNLYPEYRIIVDETTYGYNIDQVVLRSLLNKYQIMSTKFEIITI